MSEDSKSNGTTRQSNVSAIANRFQAADSPLNNSSPVVDPNRPIGSMPRGQVSALASTWSTRGPISPMGPIVTNTPAAAAPVSKTQSVKNMLNIGDKAQKSLRPSIQTNAGHTPSAPTLEKPTYATKAATPKVADKNKPMFSFPDFSGGGDKPSQSVAVPSSSTSKAPGRKLSADKNSQLTRIPTNSLIDEVDLKKDRSKSSKISRNKSASKLVDDEKQHSRNSSQEAPKVTQERRNSNSNSSKTVGSSSLKAQPKSTEETPIRGSPDIGLVTVSSRALGKAQSPVIMPADSLTDSPLQGRKTPSQSVSVSKTAVSSRPRKLSDGKRPGSTLPPNGSVAEKSLPEKDQSPRTDPKTSYAAKLLTGSSKEESRLPRVPAMDSSQSETKNIPFESQTFSLRDSSGLLRVSSSDFGRAKRFGRGSRNSLDDQKSSQADEYIANGDSQLFEGNFLAAVQAYSEALKIEPNDADTMYSKAIAQDLMGDFAEAVKTYSEVTRLDPKHAEAYCGRGSALHDLKQHVLAIKSYDQAIKINPSHDVALFKKACALQDMGQFQESIKFFNQALIAKNDHVLAITRKGSSFASLGNYYEALKLFDQALKLEPANVEALTKRADALFSTGRFQEAIASFDEAMKLKGPSSDVLMRKGNTLYSMGWYSEASQSFEEASKISPKNHLCHFNKGNSLKAMGQYLDAVYSYNEACKVNPNFVAAWINKGIALDDMRRSAEALSCYDKAIEIQPDSSLAYCHKAASLVKLGNINEGLKLFSQASKVSVDLQLKAAGLGGKISVENPSDFELRSCFKAIKEAKDIMNLIDLAMNEKARRKIQTEEVKLSYDAEFKRFQDFIQQQVDRIHKVDKHKDVLLPNSISMYTPDIQLLTTLDLLSNPRIVKLLEEGIIENIMQSYWSQDRELYEYCNAFKQTAIGVLNKISSARIAEDELLQLLADVLEEAGSSETKIEDKMTTISGIFDAVHISRGHIEHTLSKAAVLIASFESKAKKIHKASKTSLAITKLIDGHNLCDHVALRIAGDDVLGMLSQICSQEEEILEKIRNRVPFLSQIVRFVTKTSVDRVSEHVRQFFGFSDLSSRLLSMHFGRPLKDVSNVLQTLKCALLTFISDIFFRLGNN
jgi:tetratricopeptide (TPR) repeat protein